jgi:hypothetical protein
MKLRDVFIWQFAWSMMLLVCSSGSGVLFALQIALVAAAVSAARGDKWGWLGCVVLDCLFLILWLDIVVTNLWMFSVGHELYLDSPATIFIVLTSAFFFVLPPIILLRLYLHFWIKMRRADGALQDMPCDEANELGGEEPPSD